MDKFKDRYKHTKKLPDDIVTQCNRLFEQAKKCWEKGNNSGDSKYLEEMYKKSEKCQVKAEKILSSHNITCDYPGLYPTFKYRGRTYYNLCDVRVKIEDI